MSKTELTSILAGAGVTAAVMRARKSIRFRMACGILLGHPVMYRMDVRNGTIVVSGPNTKVVDCTFVNDRPVGTAIQLSMN